MLDTMNLGALDGGRHYFEWDASSYTGTGDPSFRVTAMRGSQARGHDLAGPRQRGIRRQRERRHVGAIAGPCQCPTTASKPFCS